MTEQSPDPIGVLIIDDHRMFADSLARLLSDEDDINVLGVAASAAEGVALASSLQPSVVLVDYEMPDRNGVTVVGEIKRRSPGVSIVMLTGRSDDRVLLAAIEAGCSGYV